MLCSVEGTKPSWTARLLSNPELLCKKIREEAGELCQTLEADEGAERAANEFADLLYHSMVLLNKQVGLQHNTCRLLIAEVAATVGMCMVHACYAHHFRSWLSQSSFQFG